jgi:hypothetical protein
MFSTDYVIMFSTDCTTIDDDKPIVAQFNVGPKEIAFTKLKESVNHLKSCAVISIEYQLLKCW